MVRLLERNGQMFPVLGPKPFQHPDAEQKMLDLAHFSSEDMSKSEEAVGEFPSVGVMFSDVY